MKLLRLLTLAAALMLSVSPLVFAQAAKPADPGQPAPALAPPVLFPAEAKFAFLDFQKVASDSVSGKLAIRILQELQARKATEIQAQGKEVQTMASRRDSGVLSGSALLQIGKDIDKLQREIQFAQQNAQAEIQQRQTELQGDFDKRVTPVVAEIAREKGLQAVFAADPGVVLYVRPGLDISAEVIKRLDAQPRK